MKESWKKEKAYCERKAAEYTAEMEQAIAAHDVDRFLAAHQASARYMRKTARNALYRRFLEANKEYRTRADERNHAAIAGLIQMYCPNANQ